MSATLPAMDKLFSLTGKRALVTGGNSGIGHAIATGLASFGAAVVISGRNEAKLESAITALKSQGADAVGFRADFSNPDFDAKAFAEEVGTIDILVNAAGVNLREPAESITSQSWDKTIDLNLKMPFFLAQAFVPHMRENGWGRIINIASLQTSRAFPHGLAYGASKGGVGQLTRAMAEAWSADGINANAIAPGFFHTPLTASLFEDSATVDRLAVQTAIGRNGAHEDLHGISVFLASRASDYITGQIIYVDGGFMAK